MTRPLKFLAAILLACAAATAAKAQAPAAGRPTAVKALLIGLTGDADIGPGVAADLRLVEGCVRGLPGFDADRDLKKLTGADVTAENIRQAATDLDVRPTDVLFCYYAGHGAYDPDLADGDPSGGHFFQIPGGDLRRAELRGLLAGKGARLTVLLTDTCNVADTFDPSREAADPADADPDAAPAEEVDPIVSRAFAALLFDFTGTVDVNGASRDQYGLAGETGSLSTIGLLEALDEEDEFLSETLPLFGLGTLLIPAEDPHVTWERFLRIASDDVHGIFSQTKADLQAQPEPDDDAAMEARQEILNQDDLRPQAFQLDVRPAGAAREVHRLTQPALCTGYAGPACDHVLSPGK